MALVSDPSTSKPVTIGRNRSPELCRTNAEYVPHMVQLWPK